MKALSLIQPWADLILSGKKTIELRTWNTNFRGEFLIHASQKEDEPAILKYGNDYTGITGAILGKATLVDVKRYWGIVDFVHDGSKHLALDFYDNLGELLPQGKIRGFILKNPVRCKKAALAKGALNFWEYKGEIPV